MAVSPTQQILVLTFLGRATFLLRGPLLLISDPVRLGWICASDGTVKQMDSLLQPGVARRALSSLIGNMVLVKRGIVSQAWVPHRMYLLRPQHFALDLRGAVYGFQEVAVRRCYVENVRSRSYWLILEEFGLVQLLEMLKWGFLHEIILYVNPGRHSMFLNGKLETYRKEKRSFDQSINAIKSSLSGKLHRKMLSNSVHSTQRKGNSSNLYRQTLSIHKGQRKDCQSQILLVKCILEQITTEIKLGLMKSQEFQAKVSEIWRYIKGWRKADRGEIVLKLLPYYASLSLKLPESFEQETQCEEIFIYLTQYLQTQKRTVNDCLLLKKNIIYLILVYQVDVALTYLVKLYPLEYIPLRSKFNETIKLLFGFSEEVKRHCDRARFQQYIMNHHQLNIKPHEDNRSTVTDLQSALFPKSSDINMRIEDVMKKLQGMGKQKLKLSKKPSNGVDTARNNLDMLSIKFMEKGNDSQAEIDLNSKKKNDRLDSRRSSIPSRSSLKYLREPSKRGDSRRVSSRWHTNKKTSLFNLIDGVKPNAKSSQKDLSNCDQINDSDDKEFHSQIEDHDQLNFFVLGIFRLGKELTRELVHSSNSIEINCQFYYSDTNGIRVMLLKSIELKQTFLNSVYNNFEGNQFIRNQAIIAKFQDISRKTNHMIYVTEQSQLSYLKFQYVKYTEEPLPKKLIEFLLRNIYLVKSSIGLKLKVGKPENDCAPKLMASSSQISKNCFIEISRRVNNYFFHLTEFSKSQGNPSLKSQIRRDQKQQLRTQKTRYIYNNTMNELFEKQVFCPYAYKRSSKGSKKTQIFLEELKNAAKATRYQMNQGSSELIHAKNSLESYETNIKLKINFKVTITDYIRSSMMTNNRKKTQNIKKCSMNSTSSTTIKMSEPMNMKSLNSNRHNRSQKNISIFKASRKVLKRSIGDSLIMNKQLVKAPTSTKDKKDYMKLIQVVRVGQGLLICEKRLYRKELEDNHIEMYRSMFYGAYERSYKNVLQIRLPAQDHQDLGTTCKKEVEQTLFSFKYPRLSINGSSRSEGIKTKVLCSFTQKIAQLNSFTITSIKTFVDVHPNQLFVETYVQKTCRYYIFILPQDIIEDIVCPMDKTEKEIEKKTFTELLNQPDDSFMQCDSELVLESRKNFSKIKRQISYGDDSKRMNRFFNNRPNSIQKQHSRIEKIEKEFNRPEKVEKDRKQELIKSKNRIARKMRLYFNDDNLMLEINQRSRKLHLTAHEILCKNFYVNHIYTINENNQSLQKCCVPDAFELIFIRYKDSKLSKLSLHNIESLSNMYIQKMYLKCGQKLRTKFITNAGFTLGVPSKQISSSAQQSQQLEVGIPTSKHVENESFTSYPIKPTYSFHQDVKYCEFINNTQLSSCNEVIKTDYLQLVSNGKTINYAKVIEIAKKECKSFRQLHKEHRTKLEKTIYLRSTQFRPEIFLIGGETLSVESKAVDSKKTLDIERRPFIPEFIKVRVDRFQVIVTDLLGTPILSLQKDSISSIFGYADKLPPKAYSRFLRRILNDEHLLHLIIKE